MMIITAVFFPTNECRVKLCSQNSSLSLKATHGNGSGPRQNYALSLEPRGGIAGRETQPSAE